MPAFILAAIGVHGQSVAIRNVWIEVVVTPNSTMRYLDEREHKFGLLVPKFHGYR